MKYSALSIDSEWRTASDSLWIKYACSSGPCFAVLVAMHLSIVIIASCHDHDQLLRKIIMIRLSSAHGCSLIWGGDGCLSQFVHNLDVVQGRQARSRLMFLSLVIITIILIAHTWT